MRKKILLVFTCMLLTAASMSVSASDNIFVSKGVSGGNIIPRFAINPSTGDIYAVWTQQVSGTTNLRTWGRLLKRASNGSYKPKKATMLSAADGYNANANVVYIPWKNEYLVVWDNFNFFNGLVPAQILGKRVNKRGKSKGNPFTVLSDSRANNWAYLTAVPQSGASNPAESGRVYMTYTGFPTSSNDNQAGLRIVELDSKYQATGDADVVIKSKLQSGTPERSWPPNGPPVEDAVPWIFTSDTTAGMLGDGRFQVQVNWTKQNTSTTTDRSDSGYFWFFSPDNTELLIKVLDGIHVDKHSFWVFAGGLTNVEYTLTVTDTQDDSIRLYTNPGGEDAGKVKFAGQFNNPLGRALSPITDVTAFATVPAPPGTVPAASEKFAQVIYNRENGVFLRNLTINKKGKIKIGKKENRAFGHNNTLAWMEADTYLESNTRFIIWQKNVAAGNRQIWINID